MPPLRPATAALQRAQDGDPRASEHFVHLTLDDITRYCHYFGDPDHVDYRVQGA